MSKKYTNDNVIGYFQSLEKYLRGFGKVEATVGVHADKGKEVVQRAVWNEFGTKRTAEEHYLIVEGKGLFPIEKEVMAFDDEIVAKGSDLSVPARPFVRLFLYPQHVLKICRELAKNVETMALAHKRLSQNPLKAATTTMDNIGRVAKELMRSNITNSNIHKPNTPLTQRLKGFNHPLYDTGEMLASIDSKLERRKR